MKKKKGILVYLGLGKEARLQHNRKSGRLKKKKGKK